MLNFEVICFKRLVMRISFKSFSRFKYHSRIDDLIKFEK